MEAKLYFFKFTFRDGDTGKYAFPAFSPALAWATATAYATAHLVNPSIKSIERLYEMRIVKVALEADEVSEAEVAEYLHHPRHHGI